jgi:hypothetical protein
MRTRATDVAASYVTYRLASTDQFVSEKMTFDPETSAWEATVDTSVHKVAEYFVQMVTDDGNVSATTYKALNFPEPAPPDQPAGAPVISFTDGAGNPVSPNEHGWFRKDPIRVSISGTETFQAVLDGGDPFTVAGPIQVFGQGSHLITFEGDRGSTGKVEVNIDTTAPTLPGACPGPASGVFLLNSGGGSQVLSVPASDGGPSQLDAGASVLTGTVNTASVGNKTVTFSGKDFAGNAVALSCHYSVEYAFTGFFSPVDNPPTVNSAKAGKVIALKWRLTDANGVGVAVPDSFVSVTSSLASGSCGGTVDAVESYVASSGLQYLGDGFWQFNWKTPASYAGQCRGATLNLKHAGTPTSSKVYAVASFRFK